MPITTAVILAAIVAVFMLFALVLAWGEYRTRHLARNMRPSEAADRSTAAPAAANKGAPTRVREMA
jgi:hypothetical protein